MVYYFELWTRLDLWVLNWLTCLHISWGGGERVNIEGLSVITIVYKIEAKKLCNALSEVGVSPSNNFFGAPPLKSEPVINLGWLEHKFTLSRKQSSWKIFSGHYQIHCFALSTSKAYLVNIKAKMTYFIWAWTNLVEAVCHWSWKWTSFNKQVFLY